MHRSHVLRRAALSFPAIVLLLCASGCASLQEVEGTQLGATFPNAPGRKYFVKKSPFRTTILVCDGGPRDAVCFDKPY